ncbi:hypothetical protein BDZ45DRAFT_423787 [Acephala macrosclerotiorum]|nr:hypothetical protein BDZ45DRAFT_423787 [Acephala macrosclerotiorum]
MLLPQHDPKTNNFRTSPTKTLVPYISSSTEDIPLFMQSPCHYCDTVHLAFKDLKECRRRYHHSIPPSSKASAQSIVDGDTTTFEPTHQDAASLAEDQGPDSALRWVENQPSRLSRRTQKREKWASIKDEVHQRYVIQGMTLEKTMAAVEYKHSFKASPRKWKMQIKEWQFDKNIRKNQMAILVAKAEKRARDVDKETTFYCNGKEIKPNKINNFKKRTQFDAIDAASPNAATPINITYETPKNDDIQASNNAHKGQKAQEDDNDPKEIKERDGAIVISHESGYKYFAPFTPLAESWKTDLQIFLETRGLDTTCNWYPHDPKETKVSRYWDTRPAEKPSMWLTQWGMTL